MRFLEALGLGDKKNAYVRQLFGRREAACDGGQGDGAFAANPDPRRADGGRRRRAAAVVLAGVRCAS